MIKLTKMQLNMRKKIAKMLTDAQTAFYDTGLEKFRAKVRQYLPGFMQGKFLYPAEKRKIELWLEYWGDTIDGTPAALSYIWEPETSPTAPPGSNGGGESYDTKKRLEELEAENARLKAQVA